MRIHVPTVLSLLLLTSGSARAGDGVAAIAEEIRPILIGSELPNAEVRTIDGKAIGLKDAMYGRPTVLIVYRGGWCPVCDRQLSGLRHVIDPIRELGVAVVGLSADTPEMLRPTKEKHALDIALLADFDLHAAKALGLAFHVADSYIEKLAEYGLDTEGNAVSESQVLPVPAVFVVDADGVITFSYVNPNYRVRCDPDVVLAAARAVVSGE
ncbi:AhpC/TSA family protein [bacterium]|nr:AhpC/TSA family protein [bacterium]